MEAPPTPPPECNAALVRLDSPAPTQQQHGMTVASSLPANADADPLLGPANEADLKQQQQQQQQHHPQQLSPSIRSQPLSTTTTRSADGFDSSTGSSSRDGTYDNLGGTTSIKSSAPNGTQTTDSIITDMKMNIKVALDEPKVPFLIRGGAEWGTLITISAVLHPDLMGHLNEGDILMSANEVLFPGKTSTEAEESMTTIVKNSDQLDVDFIPKDTTRPRMELEVEAEDYYFVTVDKFRRLQGTGFFLECGEFEGHLYGTPKPDVRMNGDSKGPLPPNWEIAYTDLGEKYFIDHNHGLTQWNDPRDQAETSSSSSLPEGWERVEDEVHGVFYVDHINKRTQYEKPDKLQNGYVETGINTSTPPEPLVPPPVHHGQAGPSHDLAHGWPMANGHSNQFTTDPSQLRGQLITTRLIKGPQGLGFTLVGNDRHSMQPEFIQIKSVIPGGPASMDNTLHTGDVLVYVDNDLMLGATQDEACRVLRGVPAGEPVVLQVCRGYPLLLDHTNKIYDESVYSSFHPVSAYELGCGADQLELLIRKSLRGFGFTITDSPQGQRVKSVLFPDQCPNLLEGDLILNVDGVNVLNMSHVQLVQFLQDLPVGYQTRLAIARSSPKLRSRTPTAGFRFGEKARSTPMPVMAPRSKTPAPQSKRQHYNHSTLPRSYDPAELLDEFARLRGPSARNGFNATPDYVPISALSPMIDPVYKFVTVNLIEKNGGFGFRLVGGVEMGTPLQVGTVIKGGAAFHDGRLREGDEICEIDGKNVVGFRHDAVVGLIKQAAKHKHVKLLVKRLQQDQYGTIRSNFAPIVSSTYADPRQLLSTYDVVLHKADHEDFGCTIISNVYRFIGKVLPNSPAARCGRLRAGDCVVAVNGFSADEMTHSELINYVKSCRNSIVFSIDSTKQMNLLLADGHTPPQVNGNGKANGHANASPVRNGNVAQGNGLQYLNGGEKTPSRMSVRLEKGAKGFGFSIRGGAEFGDMPLFILRIAEDGPAATEGSLRVGDQLIEINGEPTKGMTHSRAIQLIRDHSAVGLVVQRPAVPSED